MTFLYKVTKVRTSPHGFVYYTVEVHNRTSVKTVTGNDNVKYVVSKFASKIDETTERNAQTFFSNLTAFGTSEGYKTLKFNSFNFNKPLVVRRDIAP